MKRNSFLKAFIAVAARKPRHGIFTWLVCKQNNQWLITAVQNTI